MFAFTSVANRFEQPDWGFIAFAGAAFAVIACLLWHLRDQAQEKKAYKNHCQLYASTTFLTACTECRFPLRVVPAEATSVSSKPLSENPIALMI